MFVWFRTRKHLLQELKAREEECARLRKNVESWQGTADDHAKDASQWEKQSAANLVESHFHSERAEANARRADEIAAALEAERAAHAQTIIDNSDADIRIENLCLEVQKLQRSNAALRGQITKMKKRK